MTDDPVDMRAAFVAFSEVIDDQNREDPSFV